MRMKYTFDDYINIDKQLIQNYTQTLCINDMAGVLKTEAARLLIIESRKQLKSVPIPIHRHIKVIMCCNVFSCNQR